MMNRHVAIIPIVALGLAIVFFVSSREQSEPIFADAASLESNTGVYANSGETQVAIVGGAAQEPGAAASQLRGGRFHKPLKLFIDLSGVNQPVLQEVDRVDLLDSTPIIGIEVDGQAIGFVIEKMEDPKAHIVNLNFGKKHSISVTYCSLADCARVLSDSATVPIDLHVGGMDIDNQLVFLLDGERYGQLSTDLPLDDYPFTRTTLGDWQQLHPATRICVPPSRASIEHRMRKGGSTGNGLDSEQSDVAVQTLDAGLAADRA